MSIPAGTGAGMAAGDKESERSRSAGMDAAVEPVRVARQRGPASAGPGGLLRQFARTVPETALDEEMSERLGRARHGRTRDGRARNARSGTASKIVAADAVGPVRIEVPRGRDASFEPVIVRKHQRRLCDVDGGGVLPIREGTDGRGDRRPLPGDSRRVGVRGDGRRDRGWGYRGDERVVQQAAWPSACRGVRRMRSRDG